MLPPPHECGAIRHHEGSYEKMMKSMLLAIALTFPLLLSATTPTSAEAAAGSTQFDSTSNGQVLCAWIFFYGRWMCIPY
jgi:hypothetical protein